MPFPLAAIAQQRWHGNGLAFGAARANGRLHAGADLLAPARSNVFAVDDGTVYRIDRAFIKGRNGYLDAIAIRHRGGFIARYCEVIPSSLAGLSEGMAVTQGQVIAKSGELMNPVNDMIHFELYDGSGSGDFRRMGSNRHQRRADLLDPTQFLDRLTSLLNRQHGPLGLQPNEIVRAA